MDELLTCCPKCGGTLEYAALMQYSDVYKIIRSGSLSKRRIRKEDNGPMECGFFSYSNCNFVTDADWNYKDHDGKISIYQSGDQYYYKKYKIGF